MEIGTDRENRTPEQCVFSEPWTSDLSVFKNIDEPQSNLVDIRHHDSLDAFDGGVNGILFKTTSGTPLGLETYCDVKQPATTTSDFNLGLGTLSIWGSYWDNYFYWARMPRVDGDDLVVNTYEDHNNHINILYDPDRIKLLGTQNQTLKGSSWGAVSHVRIFFRQYLTAISFASSSLTTQRTV